MLSKLKKNLYICIEIKVREYLPKIYLSYLATKKNYRVYLGSREAVIDLVENKETAGGIFFYKAGLDKVSTKKIEKKIDHHVVLDEEVSPGFTKEQYRYRVLSFHRDSVKKISSFFYINEFVKKIVEKQYPEIIPKKIIPSGWPRFDILKRNKLKIFKKDTSKIRKKEKNFFLFISDFAYTSKNFETMATEWNYWGTNKKSHNNLKKKTIDEAKFHHKDYLKVSDFLINFAKKNESIKIIIRAHPNESIKIWEKKIKNIKNIKITRPIDNIIPWILASDGVLHRGSTTSIQSRLLNKKVGYINLGNHNIKNKFFKKMLYDISAPIRNINDLEIWVNSLDKKENIYKINKLFEKKNIITKIEGSKKILEVIEKLNTKKEKKYLTNKHEVSLISNKTSIIKSFILRKILIILVKLKIINRNIDRFDFVDKIYNGISAKNVNYYLKILRDKNKQVQAKQINKNLVVIEQS